MTGPDEVRVGDPMLLGPQHLLRLAWAGNERTPVPPYVGPHSEVERLARQNLAAPPPPRYSPATLAYVYWYSAQLHVLERWALLDQVGLDRGLFGPCAAPSSPARPSPHLTNRMTRALDLPAGFGLFGRTPSRRDLPQWIDTSPSRFPAVRESRAVCLLALALTPGVHSG